MERDSLVLGARVRFLRGHHPGAIMEVVSPPTANGVELRGVPGSDVPAHLIRRGTATFNLQHVLLNCVLESEPFEERLAHAEPPAMLQRLYDSGIEDDDIIQRWYDPDISRSEFTSWVESAVRVSPIFTDVIDSIVKHLNMPTAKPKKVEAVTFIGAVRQAAGVFVAPLDSEIEAAAQRVKVAGAREKMGALIKFVRVAQITKEAFALAIDRTDSHDSAWWKGQSHGAIANYGNISALTEYFGLAIRQGKRGAGGDALPPDFRLTKNYRPPPGGQWELKRVYLDGLPSSRAKRAKKQNAHKPGPVVVKEPPVTRPVAAPSSKISSVVQMMKDELAKTIANEERLTQNRDRLQEELRMTETLLAAAQQERARWELGIEGMEAING